MVFDINPCALSEKESIMIHIGGVCPGLPF
jgi:hypothetical protein